MDEPKETLPREQSEFSAAHGSALAWSQKRPTTGGLYLLRDGPDTTPTLHHLLRVGAKIQILDASSYYTGDDVEDLHESHWWYGPIPWEVPNAPGERRRADDVGLA